MRIARYAESDLLCYRAETPRGAGRAAGAAHGSRGWTGSRRPTTHRCGSARGIAYVKQHRGSVAALRGAVAALDVPALAALGVAVPAMGSLVLGLALAERRLDAATAHALGALDELFQAEAVGRGCRSRRAPRARSRPTSRWRSAFCD